MKYVCIVGTMAVGKTTFGDILLNELTSAGFVVSHDALARPIKTTLAGMFNLGIEYFDNPHLKEKECAKMNHVTPRKAMQAFGTDFAQVVFGREIWCKMLVDRTADNDITIVSDVRFEHEFEFFDRLGAKFIFVEKDRKIIHRMQTGQYRRRQKLCLWPFNTMKNRRSDIHASELGLAHLYNKKHHVLVENTTTMGDLVYIAQQYVEAHRNCFQKHLRRAGRRVIPIHSNEHSIPTKKF